MVQLRLDAACRRPSSDLEWLLGEGKFEARRTEHTKAGADGPGSAGLLSFNQKMTQEEITSATLNGVGGGTSFTKIDATGTATKTGVHSVYHTDAERSDKHELLLNNFSGTGNSHDDGKALEISTPLGQIFPFARTEYFLPCLWCIHSKVLECFWESETFPSRVVVDDVLN